MCFAAEQQTHQTSLTERIFVQWIFHNVLTEVRKQEGLRKQLLVIGSRPSDHYLRSVCCFVCLSVCLFVCAEFFSAVFDPISIKLGHMLYVWV